MEGSYSFCIHFSGLTLRFTLPTEINLPECFEALMCKDTDTADVRYEVKLLTSPLNPQCEPVHKQGDSHIYFTDEGCLRIYFPLTEEDGCQVACLLHKDGNHTMYYPASRWEKYRKYWHCTHLLWGELMLMWQEALLLHSSLVMINGKTVLFSGASGAGKSTQASLWKKHKGAEILNGDRTVIMKRDGIFLGGGSPWSGTSGIFRSEQAPIAGIFILKKGDCNRIRPLGSEAFLPLFSQTTVNSWHEEFMETVSSLYEELLACVPVYELTNKADRESVLLAYNTLFSEEASL